MLSLYPIKKLNYSQDNDNIITSFLSSHTKDEIHFYDLDYSVTNLPNQADLPIGPLANFFGGNALSSIYSIREYFPTSSLFKIYRIILFSSTPGLFSLEALKFIFQLNPLINYSYRELPNSWVILFANNLPIAYFYRTIIDNQEKVLFLSMSSQTATVLPLSQADAFAEISSYIKTSFFSAVEEYLNIIEEEYCVIEEV